MTHYFHVSFNLKVILSMVKITQKREKQFKIKEQYNDTRLAAHALTHLLHSDKVEEKSPRKEQH